MSAFYPRPPGAIRGRALVEDLGAEAAGGGGVDEFRNHQGGKIFDVFTKLEI